MPKHHNNDILERLIGSFSIRGLLLHPATLFTIASVAVIGGAIHLWSAHRELIADREDYRLTAEKIQVTDPPSWSDVDLKSLLIQGEAGAGDHSLLDTGLVSQTVSAFQTVGWVERVRRVEKTREGLKVDVLYRNPVGMVELNHMTIPDWPKSQAGQLLPVDHQAIIMPGKLVVEKPMLRFSIFNPTRFTKLENWTEWPDERVRAAATIAVALDLEWQELGLYRVVTFRKPNQAEDASIPFELWPDSGTQVIWGNPPGKEVSGEASSEEKLAALKAFVQQYGPLNKLAASRIDVRTGKIQTTGSFQTAKLESLKSTR